MNKFNDLYEEGTEYKDCPTCGDTKATTMFYRNIASKDGFAHECKGCRKILNKKKYEADPERYKEDTKEKHKANPEYAKNKRKEWLARLTKEELNAKYRIYNQTYRDKIKRLKEEKESK